MIANSSTASQQEPQPQTTLRPKRKPRSTIGFLTSWLGDPYAALTWSAVQEVARERDANLICLVGSRLHSPVGFESQAEILYELVDPAQMDGLVVFAEMLYHYVDASELTSFVDHYRPLPMTSIGWLADIPGVMLNIKEGIREMMGHLIEVHGYRRLAFIRGPRGEATAEAEYQGYLEGLDAYRLPREPNLITPPGDKWGHTVGADGVRVLLDERKLVPQVDFDAIVGPGDYEILGAVDSLRARHLRVPQDVPLTGFNNLEITRFVTPSLTTIDRHVAGLARRATEMLLDLLDGQPVPQRVSLPPTIVVRQSCGCLPKALSLPAAKEAQLAPGGRSAAPFASPRNLGPDAVRAISLQVENQVDGIKPGSVEPLLTAFTAELKGQSPGSLMRAMEETLRQAEVAEGSAAAWQEALTWLRQAMQPYMAAQGLAEQSENLWQQARVVMADFAERAQGYQRLEAAQQAEALSQVAQSLIAAFEVKSLMDTLALNLPRLSIPSCYLSLYEQPPAPTEWARLMLAYDEQGRIALEPDGRRFPSRQLVPPEILAEDRRRTWVVEALYFRNQQLGFVVLEVGPQDASAYGALRGQISSALKGALLTSHNAELYTEAVAARQMAEEANRLKSRFLSTVSHELRTPLSLIVGTIEMMQRTSDGERPSEVSAYLRDLECVRAGAEHLAHLIGDVLDLASSEAGELRLTREPLNLVRVLNEAAVVGESLTREKQLEWQVDYPPSLPLVWGDRTRLKQVILNLIGNAIKFTTEGRITLTAEAAGSQVTIAVSDTGVGIPIAEQQVIFDEFRQSERTAARGYGGMGLGLAISQRLVEMHGGQISVKSSGEEGAGSTFYFTLPVMEAPALEGEIANRAQTVLLLTGHTGGGERLREHLVQRGFTVEMLAVDQHSDCVADVMAVQPGAVVLDFEPAAECGWELMQMLKQRPETQDIPVVFYSISETQDSGMSLEPDYLTKPMASAALARALERQGLSSPGQRQRVILLVDDDPCVLDMHARVVEDQLPDCRLLKAANGREALESMQRERPDLVLLDLMMPEMDGFQVLENMRTTELTRDVPVIVLSAQMLTQYDMARLQQGVAAVLGKNLFSAAEVLAQVEAALARSKRLGNDAQRVVRQVIAYIHEHYAEPLSREMLASQAALSDRYLTHCFHQEMGIAPMTYLTRYRVKQAKTLLELGRQGITEVATAVGFSDSSYFGRVFRQEVGVSPSAYQRGERPHPD